MAINFSNTSEIFVYYLNIVKSLDIRYLHLITLRVLSSCAEKDPNIIRGEKINYVIYEDYKDYKVKVINILKICFFKASKSNWSPNHAKNTWESS